MSRSYNTELLSCQKRMCEMWKFTLLYSAEWIMRLSRSHYTNWIEVLVTIFYRRGTLNKLKFDLIKKHSSDLCKRNANKIWCLSFIVLVKIRRNFAKFRHEISSKHSRIFVKRNFAVILAKFRIHWSEISAERKFVSAKFCWLACRSDGGSGWARWIFKAGARGQRNRKEPWSGHAG